MAVFNEPTQWDTSLVVNGDTNVIPQSTPAGSGALSFDDGFPQITQVPLGAGGIAPDRKDFNAVMKLLGDAVFYMQNGGFWSYNPLFDYAVGRVVLYTDGFLYQCIQANGASSTVVAPDSVSPLGSDYWVQVATLADFANLANIDFSNVTAPTQAFKNLSIGWVMPDYSAIIAITLPYTTPSDGYILFTPNDTSGNLYVNGVMVIEYRDDASGLNCQTGMIFVQKNDVITQGSFGFTNTRFVPCKGAN